VLQGLNSVAGVNEEDILVGKTVGWFLTPRFDTHWLLATLRTSARETGKAKNLQPDKLAASSMPP
jgi:hypothetical protein